MTEGGAGGGRRRNDGLFHSDPLPSRERGFNCDVKDGSGVLCFSLGSRLRGNDGGCAGMTEGVLAGMTGVGGNDGGGSGVNVMV